MRTIWRAITKTIFWSYERGTWPYDLAVFLIVVFVLFSPRSWFNDRPSAGANPSAALVQLRNADQAQGIEVYRVDARVVADAGRNIEPQLEYQLHEAVRRNVQRLEQHGFEIVGIDT